MKKEIKIDTQNFIEALEDNSFTFSYFLDLENGNVVILENDLFDEELEDEPLDLDGYNHEIVESNPDRFMFIEPIESHESFEIMENFTLSLSDDIIKNRLSIALSKRKPFRHFKDELYNFPEVQKEWYQFQKEELKIIAYDWLKIHNIKAELTTKYLSKDKE